MVFYANVYDVCRCLQLTLFHVGIQCQMKLQGLTIKHTKEEIENEACDVYLLINQVLSFDKNAM